jgi:farnesyl diphosphate synthase
MHLPDFLIAYQTRINAVLHACLPRVDTEPPLLHQAMRYSVLGGGKRLRAMLVYAIGEALDADSGALDQVAAAVELVHAYSLIHDDLPAMDNDDLRHGRPSCHRAYGDAMAILAGDALQSLAFELLAKSSDALAPIQQLRMIEVLAQAIGSVGMVGGQVLDITAESERMKLEGSSIFVRGLALDISHQKKTGALMVASSCLGALAGNCQDALQLQAFKTFACKLGLAFQIRDDILDVEASTEVLGKTTGADSAHNKASYPAIFGLQASKERAEQLYQESLQCLAQIGVKSTALEIWAEFVVKRES